MNDNLAIKALELLKHADSVELKLTVPDSDHRSALNALQIDVLDAELRQVVFFDTPDLKLENKGIIVRARRARKGGDTVIKLRPVAPTELARELRQSSSFKVELDAMPNSIVCSGSSRGKATNADVALALQAKLPIRHLFSKEQRLFYKNHASQAVSLDSLTALGPVNVARVKFTPRNFKRLLNAEMWFFPDGSRTLELSTRCAPDEAFQVLAELRALLAQHGIPLTAQQTTKTRKALEYFSRIAKTMSTARGVA